MRPSPDPASRESELDWTTPALVLAWLLLLLISWFGFMLFQQSGRLLLRLDALEERLGQLEPGAAPEAKAPRGLGVGSSAPEFELPDLAGERRSLADFRGRPLLLVFFNPRCGFCLKMLPDLAALPVEGAVGQPLPLGISTGEAEAHRSLVDEHRLRCPILLQEQMEVAGRYQVSGTPIGYLVDAAGRIASPMAVGAQALLALAQPGAGGAGGRPVANRSLAESKINRSGLKAGTPAPDFRVPRADGGELTLGEYRGRRVLLVFSDPKCGPCNALAHRLTEAARKRPDVHVLLVNRGDAAANRAKAAEHGVSFPIGLQEKWEVSRLYEIYATPVAFLIDEEGVVAAGVATGLEPILALLSGEGDVPDAGAQMKDARKEVVATAG